MTALQDHLTTLATQTQDAMAGAARTWAESVQRLSTGAGLPVSHLTTWVDVTFDLAEQALATQRALAKAVLRAVIP